jgi:hypothetical protein
LGDVAVKCALDAGALEFECDGGGVPAAVLLADVFLWGTLMSSKNVSLNQRAPWICSIGRIEMRVAFMSNRQ